MKITRTLLGLCGAVIACGLSVGCGEPEGEFTLPAPDYAAFETQVMPILSRDCAFHACHGARQRFFQVLGPGRPRLSPLTMDSDPITQAELQFNYERARSMIDRDAPERSPLFMKPLEVGAGGAGHEGTDLFGRDVYPSKLDPAFVVLQNWVMAAGPANADNPAGAGLAPGQSDTQPGGATTMPPAAGGQ